MNRWVKIGGAVLLLAWTPFLYAELTSDPHEKKDRVVRDLEDPGPVALPSAGAAAETEEPAEDEEPDEAPEDTQDTPEAIVAAQVPDEPRPADEGIEPAAAEALAAPDNEATGEAAEGAPQPEAQGPVAALKGAFDSEPRDALWARDAEAKIGAVYARDDLPESLFGKSACQKTVCRIDLTWSQENAAPYLDSVEELHKTFGTDLAVDPQAPLDVEDEDALAVHVYVMRKGYTVADLSK